VKIFALEGQDAMTHAREIFIRLCLLAALVVSCLVLLMPFMKVIVTGIIIGVAVFPAYRWLATKLLGGRTTLAAVLCTLVMLAVVVIPCVLLGGTLVQGIGSLADQVKTGHLEIALPPALAKIPFLGPRIEEVTKLLSTNLPEALNRFMPQIKSGFPMVVAASAGLGGVVLQVLIAMVIGGFLLAKSDGSSQFADKICARIFGEKGPEFKEVVASTVRSVTNGILGVAVIQTLFAGVGFWLVGLPGAGLWAAVFLIASVLQVGPLVMIPVVVLAFATVPTTYAVIFLIWCAIVGLMDNVLKPLMLGRGSKVPMLVVFLGVLGGFAVMNIIGLFVGAVVLSVGYKLFMTWLDGEEEPEPVAEPVPQTGRPVTV
jgi:predicted PurR-regulated permease PerM